MRKNIELETAIFAGGCFWGVEEAMRGLDGVVSTETGYTGGSVEIGIVVSARMA